jgi:hypothetical protein
MNRRILYSLLIPIILASLSVATMPVAVFCFPGKEPLTPTEIIQVQENKNIDIRVRLYMDAAFRRLKTAEERLAGKEPEEGDPFELYTAEEFIDAYCQIFKTVMINLDAIAEQPHTRENPGKALKVLKEGSEKNGKELEILKRYAEDQKKEQLWNAVNRAIEMTADAKSGAEFGLTKHPAPPEKKKNSR